MADVLSEELFMIFSPSVEKSTDSRKTSTRGKRKNVFSVWGNSSLQKGIKERRFNWKRFDNKRTQLIERPQILMWRHRYLTPL